MQKKILLKSKYSVGYVGKLCAVGCRGYYHAFQLNLKINESYQFQHSVRNII